MLIFLIEQAFEVVKWNIYKSKLFFNLSPRALVLNEFMPAMRKMVVTYGIPPSHMVFEFTERDTVKNLGLVERTVHDLKKEGFSLSSKISVRLLIVTVYQAVQSRLPEDRWRIHPQHD